MNLFVVAGAVFVGMLLGIAIATLLGAGKCPPPPIPPTPPTGGRHVRIVKGKTA